MIDNVRTTTRRSAVKPVDKKFVETNKKGVYYCDDCFKTVYHHDCDQMFCCKKCNVRICKDCFIRSDKCVNCFQRMSIFLKKDEVRTPTNLEHFVEVKKPKGWSCLFGC